jgi:hypothetical protein
MPKKAKIELDDYCSYSENNGVIACANCCEDIWCNIPQVGDEVECDCGQVHEFIENREE